MNFHKVSWIFFLTEAIGFLFALGLMMKLRESDFHPLREFRKFRRRPRLEQLLILFLVCGMVQYAATKGTGAGERSAESATQEAEVRAPTMTRTGNEAQNGCVTNLCVTGISVATNGVSLEIAWPTNLFARGTTLDFFVQAPTLTNGWNWFASRLTQPGSTNLALVADWQDDFGCATNPSAMFFKVQDRNSCATTMADSDGDGLPDVYELHNGTNPYLSDAPCAPRLRAGEGESYATLAAALSVSTNYSIVEVSSSVSNLNETVTLPSHPVLITGPSDGYAVLRSSAPVALFLLDGGQNAETLFRNVFVVLTAKTSYQAAFWIGGNLPWSGVGASPTFANVRVRALYPDVLHYGWHFYRDNGGCSRISNCVMNAAGSTAATGVYAWNGPDVALEDCVFVNFSTNAGSCASWIRDGTNVVATPPDVYTNLSWAGYARNAVYSATLDHDGDGLSDDAEICVHDTDPWLNDSDGDGSSDGEEILAGTDPRDLRSFTRRATVVTTVTDGLADVTNYVAWGQSPTAWETNGLSSCRTFPATNVYGMASSAVEMYVKSYRDLNRNGRYDSDTDILLVAQLPSLDAVSAHTLRFGDVDGDGVSDADERRDGTDPYDAQSFRLRTTVRCVNTDALPTVTNHLFMSDSESRIPFINEGVLSVDLVLTNGSCAASCLRDFNGNGEFDEGVDILCTRTLTKSDNGQTVRWTIGDADSDGQSDTSERAHGTDPLDDGNFCFTLSFIEREIFGTTNRLTAAVTFGTNTLVGPVVMTNRTWTVDLGHLVAFNREAVVASFWDDVNSNGVHDAVETVTRQTFAIRGHENVLTNTLPMGAFDRDGDGMPDYWENLHAAAGLSPTNAADAWLDAETDGLANFYEHRFDLNPEVPDATNLAISLVHRSVDSRIIWENVVSDRFLNYVENGNSGEFIPNTNCWAFGVDFSCASMWHIGHGSDPSCAATNTAVTAISPRHVIFANHYSYAMSTNLIYYFLGTDGNVYTNRLTAFESIGGDIAIGRLENDLPAYVHPAKFLPDDFADYLGDGNGLPVVTLDQSERAILHDLKNFTHVANRTETMLTTGSPNPVRARFGKDFVGGDSSSPRFLLFGNEVVLLGILWRGGSGSCCHATLFKQDIEQKMNGEKLRIFDLTKYSRIPAYEDDIH